VALLTLAGWTAACSDRSPAAPNASRATAKPEIIIIPDLLPKQIVYGASTSAGPQIFRINPNGTSQVQVTSGLGGSLPSWSPDRTKIVHTRQIGGVHRLMVAKVDGSLNVTQGPGYYPRWSPDGSKIVFQRDFPGAPPQVFVMNADGTGVQQMTNHPYGAYVPGWSQDGSKITYGAAPDGGAGGQVEIWVMNANGANPHQVTDCSAKGWKCSGPDWHPTAGDNRIVYSVSPFGASASQIRSIKANGNDDTFIRSVPGFTPNKFPVWSPDGAKVAYLDLSPSWEHPEIYTINANGTQRERVTWMNFPKQGFDW
jgi:TolB protein